MRTRTYMQNHACSLSTDVGVTDAGLARARAYNQANPERVAATNKAWHQANPEEVKAYQKAWRDANPEKAAAKNKAWRKANLDKVREYCRKRRAMKVNLNENYTKEDEAYTMDLFDNMCYNCDSTDNLHIDHHKPLSRGNPLTRDNAVVLCGSCNSSKGTKSPSEFYSLGDLNLLSAILR